MPRVLAIPAAAKGGSFPLPDYKLAFVDIDDTLRDKHGRINDPRINDSIRRAQAANWVIGICSDTPMQRVAERRDQFGMNGPLVAERGAVISRGGKLHFEPVTAGYFQNIRDDITQDLSTKGLRVTIMYPQDFESSGELPGKRGEPIIFVNPFRICSVGLWARRFNGRGRLDTDDKLTRQLAALIRPHLPQKDLFYDVNYDYGVVVGSPLRPNKSDGLYRAKSLCGIKVRTGTAAMIGNCMYDLTENNLHYAVGNADPDFKQAADYVASANLTKGVVEILDKLVMAGRGRLK